MNLDTLFISLWKEYIKLTPQAKTIHELFQQQENHIITNDHIAFRTLSLKECNIDVLSKVFLDLNYERKEHYIFKEKKLSAYYFMHKNPTYPKIFISELQLLSFDKRIQNIFKEIIKNIPLTIFKSSELIYSGKHWDISYKTYEDIYKISEYAAWFYVYGFCANHFTVYINDLKNFTNIKDVNTFIKKSGFKLNTSGGEIKGSAKELLEQSSTLAQVIPIKFKEGIYNIPSCYYEFAKRYKNKNNHLFQGFVIQSADKIFESTNQH